MKKNMKRSLKNFEAHYVSFGITATFGVLFLLFIVAKFYLMISLAWIFGAGGVIAILITSLKFGDNKMLNFLKHFGKTKQKDLGNATRKMIAKADKEGYSSAVLSEMQEGLTEMGKELAETRRRVNKEVKEYEDVQKLYDHRLAAAESIKADVDAGDNSKESSLIKLIDLLENTKTSLQKEKQEAEFWTNHLDVIQKRYDDAASELSNARSKIDQSMAKMEQAEIKEEQAQIELNALNRANGLSSKMSSLDAALGALDDAAEKAEINAETSKIGLDTFRSTNIEEEDDVIKAAMEAASGTGSGASLEDRLNALK